MPNEAQSELPGFVQIGQAVQSVPRPSRQQRKVIEAACDIMDRPDPGEDEKAFLTKYLVQVTLPHSDPGHAPAFRRTNGNITLTIQPALDEKMRPLYPYGTMPRLLLYWLTREAIRQKSRRLELSGSINSFLKELGLNPATGGGKRGDAHRLREHMQRLFRARISLDATLQDGTRTGSAWNDMQVAPRGVTWWDYKHPDQGSLFESWVELGEEFYSAILHDPIPVDMRALAVLKGSAMALDLYAWATYQTFLVTRKGQGRFVPWRGLMRQVGADYDDMRDFRRKAKGALQKIQHVFPGLRLEDASGGFHILPGRPAVLPKF